ncbi:TonB-dependent receptor [Haloferula sp. BvORR071]|uniref:TonB-dependent receptor plug domain-containing protein n=1 Tax=Haloferula sp. BvORR071 TaxID=1396141 RepID=UPI0005581709|nr:TonB-dependent receptor [Haloferula sp. BvORR071]
MRKLLLLPLLASVPPVLADPAPEADALNPMIVTASRTEDEKKDVPYTVTEIDADYIQENTRRTLPDALQFTPGVLVQKTTVGHGSPYIRGFTGRQNLLMIDGVRVNNSAWRSGPVQYWNTIDPYSIDHFELVRSQGSVLYGSDAIGGTMNVFTKSSDFRDQPDGAFFTHGQAYYEYRSNGEDSNIGHIESSFGVGGLYGVHLGLSAKDYGDIRDSAVGLMKNTGYPEQDLDFRLDYALNPQTTLTLVHQQVNQDAISRWHSTLFNPGWQHSGHIVQPGTWLARTYDQERSLTYARIEQNNDDNAFIQHWNATVSYQTTRDSEEQYRTKTDRRYQIAELNTVGFDTSFESNMGPGKLVYGVDYYHDSTESEGYRRRAAPPLKYDPATRPLADDSNYELFGAFVQYQYQPVDPFELTGGLRYTYAQAELGRFWDAAAAQDQYGVDRDWDDVVGSLRAIYHFNDCWSVYGGASQAFRAPNLDDLSGNLTARSGLNSTGSADVDPEKYITYEIGTRHLTECTSVNLSAFYTDIDDLIVGVPVAPASATTVATNGRDGYVYGVELEGAWRFHPQWTVSGFAAWQDGRTETAAYLGGPIVDEPGSRLLPLTGSVALRWTSLDEVLWVEGRVLAAGEEDRLSASDRADNQRIPSLGTPGYVVCMVHAGWRVNEHLELTGGVENITNEDYRNHGSGTNEPGTNFIVGAKVLW